MIKYTAGLLLFIASCTPYRDIGVKQNKLAEMEDRLKTLSTISLSAPEYIGDRNIVEQAMKDGYIFGNFTDLYDNAQIERRLVKRSLQGIPRFSGMMKSVVCINREGSVLYAETIASETTFHDPAIRMKILNSILEYKFAENMNAPTLECGTITIMIENSSIPNRRK